MTNERYSSAHVGRRRTIADVMPSPHLAGLTLQGLRAHR